ncbi:MAG: alkaline phosphatase family protein [Gudongella sp.]|nr:alkaline phosphatase family protein [Gudongella sp.]
MLKKINLIVLIILIATVFYGCNKASEDVVYTGIYIFNENENIKSDYIPDEDIALSDLVGQSIDSCVIITSRGEEVIMDGNTILKKGEKGIQAEFDNIMVDDIVGIYIGDEIPGISKLYYDVKDSIDSEEKVLAVFLDGFSYEQYLILKQSDSLKFLNGVFLTPARSVYVPVTNAGFASMITGTLPPVNGVYDRSYRGFNVESIFGYAKSLDKKQLLIEGDIKILNTEIEPMLSVDANKNGDTDDEAYIALIQAMEDDYDFLFVHFHGIDDRGHSYGPYATETMEYIELIDEYLGQIDNFWGGKILIIADHGMHKTESSGDHGECRYEDMIVPYFIRESTNEK